MKDHDENPQSASDALQSMMDLIKVQSTSLSTVLIPLQRMHAARFQPVEVHPAKKPPTRGAKRARATSAPTAPPTPHAA
eukprot:8205552-Pyramimonas_sp.AAC.1